MGDLACTIFGADWSNTKKHFLLLVAHPRVDVVHISARKYLGLSLYLDQVPHDHIFEGPKILGLPRSDASLLRHFLLGVTFAPRSMFAPSSTSTPQRIGQLQVQCKNWEDQLPEDQLPDSKATTGDLLDRALTRLLSHPQSPLADHRVEQETSLNPSYIRIHKATFRVLLELADQIQCRINNLEATRSTVQTRSHILLLFVYSPSRSLHVMNPRKKMMVVLGHYPSH